MNKQCYNVLLFKKMFTSKDRNSFQQQPFGYDQDRNYPCPREKEGGEKRKEKKGKSPQGQEIK